MHIYLQVVVSLWRRYYLHTFHISASPITYRIRLHAPITLLLTLCCPSTRPRCLCCLLERFVRVSNVYFKPRLPIGGLCWWVLNRTSLTAVKNCFSLFSSSSLDFLHSSRKPLLFTSSHPEFDNMAEAEHHFAPFADPAPDPPEIEPADEPTQVTGGF